MSRKPTFANLRTQAAVPTSSPAPSSAMQPMQHNKAGSSVTRAASREGRKQIAGFFSPEMSFAMHMLARREGRSLQALMAEAFNDVLRKYGESPLGD